MSRDNNLVEIAKVLIDMKQERELNGVPTSVMSRYPAGSQGIIINEENYIVLNSNDSNEIKENKNINTLKDTSLKYDANFYFSTHETDEPDVIDEKHNKSKLINEAYTEVSFLPKDIYSEAEFDNDEKEKARNCFNVVIDKDSLCNNDFESFKLDLADTGYGTGCVYDEIYRCRCVFTDISGNESMKSLLIKAYKVSNQKNAEYTYQVIDNDNIAELVEELENIVKDDKTKSVKTEYSNISNNEYDEIKKHISEGIEHYYEVNSKKFYRLTRVDIKAIYCLRLRKTPIVVYFRVDGDKDIAAYNTFYSPIAKEFNVFTCPNCGKTSSNDYDSIKFHIDHDLSNSEDTEGYIMHPIGCSDCMEKCDRCGSWHFKLEELEDVLQNNYLIGKRKFLKDYINKGFKSIELCSCKEYLNWIYDEMSKNVETFGEEEQYHSEIVNNFMSSACKMVFINYLTGEVVSKNEDFMEFTYYYIKEFLLKSSRGHGKNKELAAKYNKIYKEYVEQGENYNHMQFLRNFIDKYIINENQEFAGIEIQKCIKEALSDYKKSLAEKLNIYEDDIKVTSSNKTEKCNCCDSYYYAEANEDNEMYYNEVKGLCACCAEAYASNYRMWTRADDGVTFFRPKHKKNDIKHKDNKSKDNNDSNQVDELVFEKATRIYQSKQGEILYEVWLKNMIDQIIKDKNSK